MSILIDMEMPQDCEHCCLSGDDRDFCNVAWRLIESSGRPDWCPLHEATEKEEAQK